MVRWVNAEKMTALARSRGMTDDGDGLLDYASEDECSESREFPSVAKAKDWARRNKALDLWHQPEIAVDAWPNSRRLSWERETVRRLRYVGGGLGWEEIDWR